MAERRISLEIPDQPEYLRLVRLVAGDAGARAGFDYEELDDLKLAVTELCTLLMIDDGSAVTLDFGVDTGTVTVHGELPGLAIEAGELSEAIVAVLVEEYEVERAQSRSTFRIRKAARSVAGARDA
jgi:serine/threonine-protein kinase RsbW